MTQGAIKRRLEELIKKKMNTWRCSDPKYLALIAEAKKVEQEWSEKQESVRKNIDTEIKCLKSDLEALREKRKKDGKVLIVPPHIQKWLAEYHMGVNWGGALTIRWISPDEKWAIITKGGSIAGQGTTMGTGAYYYSEVWHFLGRITQRGGHDNQYASIHGGRLTKAVKQELIDAIPRVESGEVRLHLRLRN